VGADTAWLSVAVVEPESVLVTGPRSAVARLDSVLLQPVRLGGRRDTLRVQLAAQSLPDWCTMEPALVKVTIPLAHRAP
jgi:hypothetical protein